MQRLSVYNFLVYIVLLVNIPLNCIAQEDSIIVDNSHKSGVKSFVIPAVALGTSALFTCNGWFGDVREDVQDVLSNKGHNKIKVDEYLRFAPIAAVYALDLTNVKSKHSVIEQTKILAMSAVTMGILTKGMKCALKETRPDGSDKSSFPSGHTAAAFMGAEFLYREYHDSAPWVGYTGYAVAALTGYLRIYNNKHWINDVVGGACAGVVSTKFAYWLYPKVFKKSSCNNGIQVMGLPYYDGLQGGVCLSMVF